MSPLLAGIATVDITPPVGTWLAGFAGRKKGSEGIHDPLRARALILDDGATRLALLTNDLLSLGYPIVDEIKAMIAAECDIPRERVMLNCSHTHSGPVTRAAGGVYTESDAYMRTYMRKVVGAVKMAVLDLAPARIGMGRTEVQVGINRRERTPDGGTKLGHNPDLPVAPYVDVLRIDALDGAPRAVLFTHACHPVTRAADNYQISADYPGRAQAVVEGVFAPAQALFAQGCAGNINTVPVGGSFDDVWRLGTTLAGAVIKAAAMVETRCEAPLRWAFSEPGIPLQDPPAAEEALARLEREKETLARIEADGDAQQIRVQKGLVDWCDRVYQLARDNATGRRMRYDLQAFAIGPWAIVGLPGEVFCEYQLNIAAASPFSLTAVLGVTNGCPAYIPVASEFAFGGYEVVDSMRFYGDTLIDPAAEQVILREAGALLKQII